MKTTILTPTQLKALYSTALKDDPQLIKPLALQAHAGLREIEVSRLEGDDIDFDERCIFIRPADYLGFKDPKSIDRLREKGNLKTYYPGSVKCPRFKREDLNALMA